MKAITLAMIAGASLAASLLAQTANADPLRLAQVDVDVRRGAPPRGPGVVIEKPRPPAVAIDTE